MVGCAVGLEQQPSQSDAQVGLYQEFRVERVDGRDQAGGDKADARYFVLDYVHDRFAQVALYEYAKRVWLANPEVAQDLWRELRAAGFPEHQAESRSIPIDAAAVERGARALAALAMASGHGPSNVALVREQAAAVLRAAGEAA